jgi:hypothetical protein
MGIYQPHSLRSSRSRVNAGGPARRHVFPPPTAVATPRMAVGPEPALWCTGYS